MGRRSHAQTLALWMNGDFVGTWTALPNANEVLQYSEAWLASDRGRPLSLSLPFMPGNGPHRASAVRTYFENLLPDSRQIRERVARRFRAGSTDAFALLAEIGRDCVGALQVLPDAVAPGSIQGVEATPLSDAEVAQVLRNTLAPTMPGAGDPDDDFRISIAGAQEKTALLHVDGRWCQPHGSTPTTHILKMPLGLVGNLKFDMGESVENEWLCSEILHAYVPQEDLCQATGTPPHLKYEADGGPGMRSIMSLLATSREPDRDRRTFFRAQLLFWMLRATDGHAKNFSIFLHAGGSYELTPLYDVLSAYPIIGNGPNMLSPFKAKMAMAVRSKNAHWRMHDILRRHWLAVGAEYGVVTEDGRSSEFVIDDLVARTPAVVASVRALLPEGFPKPLADSILGGLLHAASRLSDEARAT